MRKKSNKDENSVDPVVYKDISVNDLILCCMSKIKNEKCTFENLIEICFQSFPKTFGFENHPNWPDSRKLDRPLRTLRKDDLIVGDPKTSFSLTEKGKKQSVKIVKKLNQKKLPYRSN